MPIVAVVAAIAVDIGPIGAIIGGTAGAISTLTAITAIGATLGAIGAVTGNKTLGLVGGALGLVGGIGSLAFGSGALGTVGDLFGSSSSGTAGVGAVAVSDLPPTTSIEGGVGADTAGAASTGATSGTDITTAAGGLDPNAVNPAGAINATSIAPAEGNAAALEAGSPGGAALDGSLATAPLSSTSSAPLGQMTDAQLASSATAGAPPLSASDLAAQFSAENPLGSSAYDTSLLSGGLKGMDAANAGSGGIWNWAKNNQLLAYGVLQSGGSFISGLTNTMTPAQIAALNSQANANNAAAALAERETANMGQPIPVASITGAPAAAGGLINNKPVATPLITGAPQTAAQQVPGTVTGAPA